MKPYTEPGYEIAVPDGPRIPAPKASRRKKGFSRDDEEYARLCIEAATLHSQHASYVDIARTYNLATPDDAKRLVAQGYALIPSDDVHEGRKAASEDLHRLAREMWKTVLDPGPLVSQGKIMRKVLGRGEDGKPVYGEAYPDVAQSVRAGQVVLSVHERLARMNGHDSPRQMIIANVPIEEIRAHVEMLRREIGEDSPDEEDLG